MCEWIISGDAISCLGCTDSTAFNYDPTATIDNGSCIEVVFGCTNETAFNYNALANTDDGSCIEVVLGCTDATAFNYDPLANTDDGSCIEVVGGCTDETAFNYDPLANTDDGSCVEIIEGCTDETAFNYDPLANTDDGSCIETIEGCIDPSACNYDETANTDDGSCNILNGECDTCIGGVFIDNDLDDDGICDADDICPNDPFNDLDGDGICGDLDSCPQDPLNDIDGDGICANDEILGCTNPSACNYNFNATEESGSCIFAIGCDYCSGATNGTGYVVDGDVDNDGVCDFNEIDGCTDFNSCNFDNNATEDDDSCEYPSDLYPEDLYDSDGDGINDTSYVDCDGNCLSDIDSDGVCDEVDNCPEIFNPDQEDNDEPGGPGDPCDGINLEEDDNVSINIFPNPVSSNLNIIYNSNSFGDIKIKLMNSIGQVLFNENYFQNQILNSKLI